MPTGERDLTRYATEEYRGWNRERMRRLRSSPIFGGDPAFQAKERAYEESERGRFMRSTYENSLARTASYFRGRAGQHGVEFPNTGLGDREGNLKSLAWWRTQRAGFAYDSRPERAT